jgi:nucleoside-diphosphate-sugar epimerase
VQRVLVTGLAGFTGAHLRRSLEAAGLEVFATPQPPLFDLRERDHIVAELERVRPDYVIHLAGISFVPHGDAVEIYGINTIGSTLLLEAIHQVVPEVRKVILASSANVYGNAENEPIAEDTPPCPVNHYGCAKLSMEFMARTWFDRLPVVVTRPFNYTGPGQAEHFLVPKLVSHFARRAPGVDLGNLGVVRDFSDVRMVCDAYTRLLRAPVRSTVLNVCSGVGRSLHWVVQQLQEICGHQPDIKVDPSLVRAVEVRRLVGSNAALIRAIGPLAHLDFRSTLEWMCEDFRAPGA